MLGPVKFIGGRLCLDFVNTVGARVSAHRGKRNRDYADSVVRDKIASYEDLLEWGRLAGIVAERDARALLREAASHPQEAQAVLARAAALRGLRRSAPSPAVPSLAHTGVKNDGRT